MDLFIVVLGLLGFVALIGGVISFFSLFSKGDDNRQLVEIENELALLRKRIATLEKAQLHQKTQSAEQTPSVKTEAQTLVSVPLTATEVASVSSEAAAAHAPKSMPETGENKVTHATSDAIRQTAHKVSHAEYAENTLRIPINNTSSTPGLLENGFTAARDWLLGGNSLVRSGIVILFLGIAFLLKFAADNDYIPIELRLAAIALFGTGLLVLGWRLRDQRTEYAWALQGGGVGILYLTIFAALKLYQLIPVGVAFALLIAVAFLSALIAVLQSALPLAILGFSGGFLAPIFTSSGHGSHVGLFSYYLILNLGIAFIAYHKSWRSLNLLGFAFTFIIGSLWGAKNYLPEHFASTEPFLVIHFLLFTAIAVLYAFRQAIKATDYVDATLVFGTPLVGFSLQYALLRDSHFGLAYSALALGIFYLALAWWVLKREHENLKFLGECFLALGTGFATLTLPLALDGRWTSAAWAVEGVGLVWVGLRQHRKLALYSGLALQLLGAFAFVQGWGLTGHTGISHQNMFLGVGFIALSGWACGALWNAYRQNEFPLVGSALALWGWLWWVGAGLTAIEEFLPDAKFFHAGLAFIAVTSVLLPYVANRLKWPKLAGLVALLLPAMIFAMLADAIGFLFFQQHPFGHDGLVCWLTAMAAYAWLLRQDLLPQGAFYRAPVLWIMAAIGVMEWQFQLAHSVQESRVWKEIGWAIVPMGLVAGVSYWKFAKQSALSLASLEKARAWVWAGCLPMMAFLVAWFFFMSFHSDGNALPLPYLPLINPLDITLAAVLLLLLIWQRIVSKNFGQLQNIRLIAGLMGFALLNGVLLRTLHHWSGTPFQWTAIFNDPLVQMAFTFMWGITAFILMLLAHKRARRNLWIAGAALMGLVVVKIFLLDLAQHGTVERIISFIGAGIMLLVMGYFAPMPPIMGNVENKTAEKEQA